MCIYIYICGILCVCVYIYIYMHSSDRQHYLLAAMSMAWHGQSHSDIDKKRIVTIVVTFLSVLFS